MNEPDTPTHDCEILGKDAPCECIENIETGDSSWGCGWCKMAKKVKGDV